MANPLAEYRRLLENYSEYDDADRRLCVWYVFNDAVAVVLLLFALPAVGLVLAGGSTWPLFVLGALAVAWVVSLFVVDGGEPTAILDRSADE